jgi:hypothetical protein
MKIVHIRTTMFDQNVTSGRLVGRTKLSHNDDAERTISTVLRLGATTVHVALITWLGECATRLAHCESIILQTSVHCKPTSHDVGAACL